MTPTSLQLRLQGATMGNTRKAPHHLYTTHTAHYLHTTHRIHTTYQRSRHHRGPQEGPPMCLRASRPDPDAHAHLIHTTPLGERGHAPADTRQTPNSVRMSQWASILTVQLLRDTMNHSARCPRRVNRLVTVDPRHERQHNLRWQNSRR